MFSHLISSHPTKQTNPQAHKPINTSKAQDFIAKHVVANTTSTINWTITFEEFLQITMVKASPSAGPAEWPCCRYPVFTLRAGNAA